MFLNLDALYDFLFAVIADVESLVSLPQNLTGTSKGAWNYLVRLGKDTIYFTLLLPRCAAFFRKLISQELAELLNHLSVFTEASHIHRIVTVNVSVLLLTFE